VVSAEGVDDEGVVGPFGVFHDYGGRQAVHREGGAAAHDLDEIVAVGAVDDDGVGLTVAGGAAGRACQVEVDLGEVGPGQVVEGDLVRSAEGVEINRLHAVEVHRDVGDVAREAHPRAVGGDVHALGDVGPVEQHGVVA